MRLIVFTLAFIAMSPIARAQEPPSLIDHALPTPPQKPPGQFIQSWYSGFNVSPLRSGAPVINLNLPNAPAQLVSLELFEARAGYIFEDVDGDGDFDPVPDPDAAPHEISWRWYGRSSEWTVALTYEQGVLAGRISGQAMRYAVTPRANDVTELGEVNSSYWKTHSGDTEKGAAASIQVPTPTKTENVSAISTATSEKGSCPIEVDAWDAECPGPAPTGSSVIDVLMIYTGNSLAAYGSSIGVRAVMQSAIDDANISLRNAGVYSVRFWMRASEQINTTLDPTNYESEQLPIGDALKFFGGWAYQEECPYITFPGNPYISSRRNAYQADIVALSLIPDGNPGSCGVAFAQNVVSAGYLTRPGPKFEKFSYLVFNPECGADRLNFAHEAGHLLGLEHDPRNSTFASGQVSGETSCPWSYGHRRAGSLSDPLRFRTVMAYWQLGNTSIPGPAGCGTSTDLGHCPLIDSYSNPAFQWNGTSVGSYPGMPNIGVPYPPPSGLQASREHDTLARIGPIVEAFRARAELIFADTFQ